ncbi:MAG: serine/threonine protein kinase [Aquificaceae bacterium]
MKEIKEGSVVLGTYQVLSFLGKGAFGSVYKVKVLEGRYKGKVMALKVAKDVEVLPYLWKEVQTLLLFNHPHIVSMQSYLYEKDRNELYVLYEFMDAGDLKDYLLSKGSVGEREALRILFHIARGLEFLHKRGYIHGDIKPENVFGKRVLKDIVWKLGDFGLVRIRGSSHVLDVKGTLGYIAPEVFHGEIHRSSDIFSLGCVLYFMLTGKDPFDDADKKEKLRRNKLAEYSMPSGISHETQEIIRITLDTDYKKRFRTAMELIDYIVKGRLA